MPNAETMLTKRPITLRVAGEIPPGTPIHWRDGYGVLTLPGNHEGVRVRATTAARALGIPEPDDDTIDRWCTDSIVESVMGEPIEPDGIDAHGSPSWLLALGLI
jgi:hypothetical protein